MAFERRYSFGSVTPATDADLPILARELRAIDILELKKFANLNAETALRMSLATAMICCCIRDREGTPVTILGVCPHPQPRCGMVWMLSTDKIDRFGLLFLQETRELIDGFVSGYDAVANLVYAGNTKTVKWLKWLGFEIVDETETTFSDGELFYEMVRFRDAEAKEKYVSLVDTVRRRNAALTVST